MNTVRSVGLPSRQSLPPEGWWEEEYLLTADAYVAIVRDFAAALNRDGIEIGDSGVTYPSIAVLLARVADGTISAKTSKEIFEKDLCRS